MINFLTGKNAVLKMMKANEDLLKSIITLAQASVDGPCDVKLVAETLGFFCSCGNLSLFLQVFLCPQDTCNREFKFLSLI